MADKLKVGFAGAGAISRYHLVGWSEMSDAQVAKVNRELAGEDAAVVLLKGAGGLTAVLDGNISAPGYGPLPTDQLDNLETLKLMEASYVAAGVKV